MRRLMIPLLVCLCFLLSFANSGQSAVIYISAATGADTNDGSSWALAKKTVTAGLATAVSGDQVWVAKGLYVERITLKDGVRLYGGFSGAETELSQRPSFPRQTPDANETVLDGNKGGSVVTAPTGVTSSAGIDGFTVRNGSATYGGGITCMSSSPNISECIIAANSATYGGGISCQSSSPTLRNCMVTANTAAGSGGHGGGIYCYSSSPAISHCFIAANHGRDGGGIYCNLSSPAIYHCTITGNDAISSGGGLYCNALSSPVIYNNIIALNASGIVKLAGSGSPILRNNCVYGNTGYNYSGLSAGVGDISQDPKLVAVEYGQTHIQPGSPCVDAGDDTVVQAGWVDMDGQARIRGNHVDIGADESDGTVWNYSPPAVRVSLSGNDANDGSSWALAKRTVQAGINTAFEQGAEVWVAGGTYYEKIGLRPCTHLYGGFAATETERSQRNYPSNATIIDAGKAGTVVTIPKLAVYYS